MSKEELLEQFQLELIGMNGIPNEQVAKLSRLARIIYNELEHTVEELERVKSHISASHTVDFIYEDGNIQQLPLLAEARGITNKGFRPVDYAISFTPEEYAEWIECEVKPALKKQRKINDI